MEWVNKKPEEKRDTEKGLGALPRTLKGTIRGNITIFLSVLIFVNLTKANTPSDNPISLVFPKNLLPDYLVNQCGNPVNKSLIPLEHPYISTAELACQPTIHPFFPMPSSSSSSRASSESDDNVRSRSSSGSSNPSSHSSASTTSTLHMGEELKHLKADEIDLSAFPLEKEKTPEVVELITGPDPSSESSDNDEQGTESKYLSTEAKEVSSRPRPALPPTCSECGGQGHKKGQKVCPKYKKAHTKREESKKKICSLPNHRKQCPPSPLPLHILKRKEK